MLEASDDVKAWETFLDSLELELQLAEPLGNELSVDRITPWEAPAEMPPLPQELSDRARKVLADQTAMLLRLETTRKNTRKHLQYLDANAANGLVNGPLFIDDLS